MKWTAILVVVMAGYPLFAGPRAQSAVSDERARELAIDAVAIPTRTAASELSTKAT